MPDSIAIRQNSPQNVKLLVAQHQLYTDAKRVRSFRLLGSVLLAVAAPFVLAVWPGWSTGLGAVGSAWLLLDQVVLKHLETKTVKRAATTQEEFDTNLFQLPWNSILAGDRVQPEIVNDAAHRFIGDTEKFSNWYPELEHVLYPLDVLIYQRLNLVWDWQLRRYYAVVVLVLTTTYLSLLIWFGTSRGFLLIEFILGLLLPASSAIAEGISVALDHLRIASEKEETAGKVMDLWEQGIHTPTDVTVEKCRDVQDAIYLYRSTGPLVPNWWYKWLRNKLELNISQTAAELTAQAQQVRSTN